MIEVRAVDLAAVWPEHLLSDEERQRAAGFGSAAARRAFVACRAALRTLAPDGAEFCSISHSGGWGLVAVADAPVGVDIERVRDVDVERLVRRFDPTEAAAIDGRLDAFFRAWTRKEAVFKALAGAVPFDGVVVDVNADRPVVTEGLTVGPVRVADGYEAALAVGGGANFPASPLEGVCAAAPVRPPATT